jgi:hypothetical protein
MLKLSLKAVAIGVFLGVMLFFAYGRKVSQASNPRVVISEQPGSPLLILSTFVDVSKPLSPRYGYSITNTGDKPISAFAIQESVSLLPGAPSTSTSFTHFPTVKLLLRPHASMQEEGGAGRLYEQPPVEVGLSVDFVEFADGTRWGVDVGKSGERLDGQRAGGKAAIKKYREVLANKGVESLELALAGSTVITPESQTGSADWQEGFQTGVDIVKHRLAGAKLKDGLAGIKSELDKPFDSKGGRREP